MGKFKKGLFLGGLLGAGLTWLNTTKKGREVREKLLDHSAEVYLELKDKVLASETWDKMTKKDFIAMARETVDKYAVKNGLADKAKKSVVKLVGTQWGQLQKEVCKKKKGKKRRK
jgi:gas vesicle protein